MFVSTVSPGLPRDQILRAVCEQKAPQGAQATLLEGGEFDGVNLQALVVSLPGAKRIRTSSYTSYKLCNRRMALESLYRYNIKRCGIMWMEHDLALLFSAALFRVF